MGNIDTCQNSILSLRKRGKHIQIGLMTGQNAFPPIPMGPIIANELEILGSHGMQAHQYPEMLALILNKKIPLEKMIGQALTLEAGCQALMEMNQFKNVGTMIINQF